MFYISWLFGVLNMWCRVIVSLIMFSFVLKWLLELVIVLIRYWCSLLVMVGSWLLGMWCRLVGVLIGVRWG